MPELTLDDVRALKPTVLGPTWRKDEKGKWVLPKHTLGWQILGWVSAYLNSVAEGADEDDKFQFTPEQARFILWWYAIDEHGRFIYRRGVLQRLKGWGKDPLLAVIAIVEFVGPSRFSHWDESGKPVARSHPRAWVQIAAVSGVQTKNTMTLLPALMSREFVRDYGIKLGAELIRADRGTKRIEAVTSNPRTLEGNRATFVMLNETQHWLANNNGHLMYQTIDGNAAKGSNRYLAVTNAPMPGEDSIAEQERRGYEKLAALVEERGWERVPDMLYDSIEAHPDTPLTREALEVALPTVRGDATWVNVDSVIASVNNPLIGPSRSRRMWLNQIVAADDALHSPATWDPLRDESLVLKKGDRIVLGLDGGRGDDATALVAIRLHDCAAFLLGLWERPDGPAGDAWDPAAVLPEVDMMVHQIRRDYRLAAFYSDVALLESWIVSWDHEFGDDLEVASPKSKNAIGWDMRTSLKESTQAHERLMRRIFDRMLRHNGDPRLRLHVLNAVRRPNNFGLSFGKESRESPRKVDAYAALMLAHEAYVDVATRGGGLRDDDDDQSFWAG